MSYISGFFVILRMSTELEGARSINLSGNFVIEDIVTAPCVKWYAYIVWRRYMNDITDNFGFKLSKNSDGSFELLIPDYFTKEYSLKEGDAVKIDALAGGALAISFKKLQRA